MDIADAIYDLLMGETEIIGNTQVENMFTEGQPCDELYNQVYEANLRLCERLGVQEDADIELIIDCLMRISRILGQKMFHYGAKYQSGEL